MNENTYLDLSEAEYIEQIYSGILKTICDLIHIANYHDGSTRRRMDREILMLSSGLKKHDYDSELIHLTVDQAKIFGLIK